MRSLAFCFAFVCSCGAEEGGEHAHDAADFASRAACEEHYEEEGHDTDEIEDLCAGLS